MKQVWVKDVLAEAIITFAALLIVGYMTFVQLNDERYHEIIRGHKQLNMKGVILLSSVLAGLMASTCLIIDLILVMYWKGSNHHNHMKDTNRLEVRGKSGTRGKSCKRRLKTPAAAKAE